MRTNYFCIWWSSAQIIIVFGVCTHIDSWVQSEIVIMMMEWQKSWWIIIIISASVWGILNDTRRRLFHLVASGANVIRITSTQNINFIFNSINANFNWKSCRSSETPNYYARHSAPPCACIYQKWTKTKTNKQNPNGKNETNKWNSLAKWVDTTDSGPSLGHHFSPS